MRLVLGALTLLCACSDPDANILDHKKGQHVIGDWLAHRGLREASVTCPRGVQIEMGKTFECEATVPSAPGVKVAIVVSQTDEKGSVSYALSREKPVVITETLERQLAASIRDRFRTEATVTCGARRVYAQEPGKTIVCKVTSPQAEPREVTLELMNEEPGWRELSK
jgi:hypothetical protein